MQSRQGRSFARVHRRRFRRCGLNNLFAIALSDIQSWLPIVAISLGLVLLAIGLFILVKYGRIWLQAYMSGIDVSFISLIGMSLRRVNADAIVQAQVMAKQAGVNIADGRGMNTASLEAHYLAGGNINRVVVAIIAANRAGIDLDFERARCD